MVTKALKFSWEEKKVFYIFRHSLCNTTEQETAPIYGRCKQLEASLIMYTYYVEKFDKIVSS